jgi:hypothetical protein
MPDFIKIPLTAMNVISILIFVTDTESGYVNGFGVLPINILNEGWGICGGTSEAHCSDEDGWSQRRYLWRESVQLTTLLV